MSEREEKKNKRTILTGDNEWNLKKIKEKYGKLFEKYLYEINLK